MKITLLLAECTSDILLNSLKVIQNVLTELDVQIHRIDLTKLSYFNGSKNRQSDEIINTIKDSKGVIAITSIPLLTMHGAMQSFFDVSTLYEEDNFSKPMMAISYSESFGEQEVANTMLRCWSVLGGADGGKIFLNSQMNMEEITTRIEREIEDFYRLLKQNRVSMKSSEYMIFKTIKTRGFDTSTNIGGSSPRNLNKPIEVNKEPEIKNFVDIIREEGQASKINLSTKEQTIKEITSMLKKESKEDQTFDPGVYTRPPRIITMDSVSKKNKIQQLPHYFIAKHEKDMNMVLKYIVVDEDYTGYIVIRDGDCVYEQTLNENSTVELILNDDILNDIIEKKITYQKAFMLGKLKVKGNFAVLPKLDKIFK